MRALYFLPWVVAVAMLFGFIQPEGSGPYNLANFCGIAWVIGAFYVAGESLSDMKRAVPFFGTLSTVLVLAYFGHFGKAGLISFSLLAYYNSNKGSEQNEQ